MKKKIFVVAAVLIGSHLLAQEDTTSKTMDEVVITRISFRKRKVEQVSSYSNHARTNYAKRE
jgi:hypothetical protein